MATVTGITAQASVLFFAVTTGSEPRPATPGMVMWIGGTTKPTHMADDDIWLKESSASASAPEFVTTSLNTITQSVAFSQPLVLNGTTPMTFSITTGVLPAGLTIHTSTGVISGTPTTAGAYTFTVQATNAVGSSSQAFAGSVSATAVAPNITTTTLSTLVQGTAFAQTLSATGTTPMSFSISGGVLPSGLTLNSSTGAITGTPTGTGAYSFTVQASNSAGTDTQAYTGTIGSTGTAPEITTTTLNAMQVGTSFSHNLTRTGSTPITWGVSTGTIPAGLSINSSTGTISGTPTTAGAYSFTVQATNAFGSDTQVYTGTVAAATTANTYSVFAGTVPASLTSYTDGDSGAWLSQQYYQWAGATALPSGSKITGARLYVPAGSSHIGQTWFAAFQLNAGGMLETTGSFNPALYNSNGSKKEGSVLVEGWNEVLFDLEYDVPPSTQTWFIGTQIGTGTRYLHNTTLNADAIREITNKNFFLAETAGRCWYNSIKTSATWYGSDTLVKLPA